MLRLHGLTNDEGAIGEWKFGDWLERFLGQANERAVSGEDGT